MEHQIYWAICGHLDNNAAALRFFSLFHASNCSNFTVMYVHIIKHQTCDYNGL